MKRIFKYSVLLIMPLSLLALLGVLLMLLWNALLPDMLSLPAIGWLQAVGLLLIGCVFFGSFAVIMMAAGGLMRGLPGRKRSFSHREWHNMSDEERRNFIENWRRRHRGTGADGNEAGDNQ